MACGTYFLRYGGLLSQRASRSYISTCMRIVLNAGVNWKSRRDQAREWASRGPGLHECETKYDEKSVEAQVERTLDMA